jgi:hypothetical protein
MPLTTMKVHTATRDRVKEIGRQTSQTSEQVILAALDELERRRRLDLMRLESEAVRADADDVAEARAVMSDMDSLRAW